MSKKSSVFAFTVALFCLGLMISFQYKTQQIILNDLSLQSSETLISLASQLYEKQTNLSMELYDLQDQLDSYRAGADEEDALIGNLKNENTRLEIANCSTAVSGPGIKIDLSYGIIEEDLVSIINDLCNSGAEAISVNGIRYTNYSYFNYDYSQRAIIMDNIVLDGPYTILAIGNPDTLDRGIQLSGGIISELIVYYNITVGITKMDNIVLPAATTSQIAQYSGPAE